MSKDLRWFKFYPTEWMMGRIQRESSDVQVSFIRLMCKYWHKECDLIREEAALEIDPKHLDILINKRLIEQNDNRIIIKFLDEQISEIQLVSKKNSNNARKRWDKERNAVGLRSHPTAMQNDADKIREDKEEDKIRDIPDLEVVLQFCKEQCNKLGIVYEDIEQPMTVRYEAWKANDWADANNKPIGKWQFKVINAIGSFPKLKKPQKSGFND